MVDEMAETGVAEFAAVDERMWAEVEEERLPIRCTPRVNILQS